MRILNARELEILRLVVDGYDNKQIASTLYLSPHTVKGYLRTAFRKLRARNRTHAAAIFYNSRWN